VSTSLLLYTVHFEQDCFVPDKKICVLKSDAVPSIFPSFPRTTIPVEQSLTHDHPYLLPPAKGLKRQNNHLVEESGYLKNKIKLLKDSKQKLIKKLFLISFKQSKTRNLLEQMCVKVWNKRAYKCEHSFFKEF
jgi:hypothetical protein